MSLWHLRDVPLKFQIGDWTAFRVNLPLHVRAVQLTEHLPAADSPTPPAGHDTGDAAGYFIHSLPVGARLPTLSVDGDYIRYVPIQYSHCYIDLSIGAEAYRSKFSAKTRSTITRKIKKFKEHCGGQLRWSTYSTPEAMPEFHRLARMVSARTYQERLLDAGIPTVNAFVDNMIALAAEGQVRGYILFAGEEAVSYLYCPAEDGTLIYAFLGYDPQYMSLSVGTVLQWLALEQLFEEKRFAFFDFTEGQSEHKRLFATHDIPSANVMFVRYTFGRLVLLRAHALTNRLSSAAGNLAARWGLKASLRRMLRFGWSGSR